MAPPYPPDSLDAAQRLRLGALVGDRYELNAELGRGAAGTVFLAYDRKHSRKVALKVLRNASGRSSNPARFRREVAIAAQLNHPHIVTLHDSGGDESTLFYVMPYVEGETLRERIRREGRLGVDAALGIASDVAEALDYAHARGVIHRDVKPGNILLTSGHALVADFGVAHALEAAEVQDVTSTTEGGVGTPAYMSPEQAFGDAEIDGRADVYSLGCLVYEMVTGERPYTARTPIGQLAQHLQASIPSAGAAGADIEPHQTAAIERALAKHPGDRFETAGDFVAALRGEVTNGPVFSRAKARRWLHHRGSTIVGTAAAILVISAVFFSGMRAGAGVPAWSGRPASVLVLGVHAALASEAEQASAARMASDVTAELNRWDSIYAVPAAAIAGPLFDLGMEGPTTDAVSGLQLAGEMGVQAFLALSVEDRDGLRRSEATLYDVVTGAVVAGPWVFDDDAEGAPADRISFLVLGLDPDLVTESVRGFGSTNAAAVGAFAEGRDALLRWRLDEAEASFRTALDLDPDFPLAAHGVAQTLYWANAELERLLERVGPEIQEMSARALRGVTDVRSSDSLHVRGFFAFQEGDYETSRRAYRRAVEENPGDLVALVMQGSVEHHDIGLGETDHGLRPRRSLNVMLESLRSALQLQPTLELAHARAMLVPRVLVSTAYLGGCPGFVGPDAVPAAPWVSRAPGELSVFCPVVTDSIEWLTEASFRSVSPEPYRTTADRVFSEVLTLVERWAAYVPDERAPPLALADALGWKRTIVDVAPPEVLREEAAKILGATATALGMATDSSSADLYRLATLHVASGDLAGALELSDLAATMFDGAPVVLATNVHLAVGRVEEALRSVAANDVAWMLELPDGELTGYGGAERWVDRMVVLAPVIDRLDLAAELITLEAHWPEERFSGSARSVLMADATRRVLAAFVERREVVESWSARLDTSHPLLEGLVRSDLTPPEARRLAALGDSVRTPGISLATRAYVAGHVLLRGGDPAGAARYFARLDSLAPSVRFFDATWGLQAVARLHRGRAYEAAGDDRRALESYRAFVETWVAPDDLSRPLVEAARRRIEELGGTIGADGTSGRP